MKIKSIKIMSLFLSGMMFFSSTPVYADFAIGLNSTGNSEEYVEYEEHEFTDKTGDSFKTLVYAQVASSYKVTIPKVIVLSGVSKRANYYVKVEGDLAADEILYVVPDNTVDLYSNNKSMQTGTITQDIISWCWFEMNNLANGQVIADGITAGKWSGNFNFNIHIEKTGGELVLGDLIIPPVEDWDESDPTELNLSPNDTKTLDLPEDAEAVSSDENIVKIEDDKIITVGPGEAEITITKDEKTYKILVNVVNPNSVLYKAVGKESKTVTVDKDGTYKLTVAASPGQYAWGHHLCPDVSDGHGGPELAFYTVGGTGEIKSVLIYLKKGTTLTLNSNTQDGNEGSSWRFNAQAGSPAARFGYPNSYISVMSGTGGSGSSATIGDQVILSSKGGDGSDARAGLRGCGYLKTGSNSDWTSGRTATSTPFVAGGAGGGSSFIASDEVLNEFGAYWISDSLENTLSSIQDISEDSYNSGFVSLEYVSAKLTIDPNGGQYNGSSDFVSFNITSGATKTLDTPTWEGHTFKGWEVVKGGNNVILTDSTIQVGTQSIIIKAIWE